MEEKRPNPIDPEKVAENPHLLPYAHTVGSAIIKPIDKGRTKGVAMSAMYQQTETQLVQIKEQVELLLRQAQGIHNRIAISEKIYKADIGFKAIPGRIYFLYERKDTSWMLSLISPEEWGGHAPFKFVAEVKLLADHTWEVVRHDGLE